MAARKASMGAAAVPHWIEVYRRAEVKPEVPDRDLASLK